MSVTSMACPACGRLDYPHVCKSVIEPYTFPQDRPERETVIADLTQARITWRVHWTWKSDQDEIERQIEAEEFLAAYRATCNCHLCRTVRAALSPDEEGG